jgi:hypothetical protein
MGIIPERHGNMSEQSRANKSAAGEEGSATAASTTTVSDATLERFACSFEASARRWELVVYPMMLAFVILAAYGFYLIYSMTRDVHRVTEQMEPIARSMVAVSDNMVRVTANMSSMTANVHTITDQMVHLTNRFDEGIAIAGHMDQSVTTMVPIAQRMQYDADVMTQRIYNVTGPMNFMSDMFPMGEQRR